MLFFSHCQTTALQQCFQAEWLENNNHVSETNNSCVHSHYSHSSMSTILNQTECYSFWKAKQTTLDIVKCCPVRLHSGNLSKPVCQTECLKEDRRVLSNSNNSQFVLLYKFIHNTLPSFKGFL